MRTIVSIDPTLLEENVKATGAKSEREAIHLASQEYMRGYRLKKLLELEGALDLNLDDWHEFRHVER